MTNKKLLKAMSLIDEKYVEAAKAAMIKGAKKKKRKYIAAIAACLGLLMGSVVIGGLMTRDWESPVPESSTKDGLTSPNANTGDEDFEIIDGSLLAYRGNSTEVVIPNEVKEITHSAFSENDNVKTITSLYIGENVENIHNEAFVSLTGLQKIEVAKNNEYYVSKDGVLGRVDGSDYFAAAITSEEASYRFTSVINELRKQTSADCSFSNVMIGQGRLKLQFEEGQKCRIVSVSALGYTKELLGMYAEGGLYSTDTGEAYTISFISSEGSETALIFTKEGLYEISCSDCKKGAECSFHTKFSLKHAGKEVVFDGRKTNWKTSKYYYEDLTGDGSFELVAVFVWGTGTGAHEEDIYIFEANTLSQYRIEDMSESLGEHVVFSADETTYKISTTGKDYLINKAVLESEREHLGEVVSANNIYRYSVENGQIVYRTKCFVSPTETIGEISVTMMYTNDGFVYSRSDYTATNEAIKDATIEMSYT
ncbi:MAG: hypothetical protein E7615_04360 [Ruminococcaceae bacterium]|nr:hypothetical protein [Oscillospiraceae bacterium]